MRSDIIGGGVPSKVSAIGRIWSAETVDCVIWRGVQLEVTNEHQ